ncbi:hypothetical protein ACFFX0_31750 [Citricoccus parietis]|uniref:Uncharacterized protein n=1 Tax=Citricoccus parietis TaxID=592307 RepID=A0ABV5G953_9MICC
MGGVGQEGQAAGDHAADGLGHHDDRSQAESDEQPAAHPPVGSLRHLAMIVSGAHQPSPAASSS